MIYIVIYPVYQNLIFTISCEIGRAQRKLGSITGNQKYKHENKAEKSQNNKYLVWYKQLLKVRFGEMYLINSKKNKNVLRNFFWKSLRHQLLFSTIASFMVVNSEIISNSY